VGLPPAAAAPHYHAACLCWLLLPLPLLTQHRQQDLERAERRWQTTTLPHLGPRQTAKHGQAKARHSAQHARPPHPDCVHHITHSWRAIALAGYTVFPLQLLARPRALIAAHHGARIPPLPSHPRSLNPPRVARTTRISNTVGLALDTCLAFRPIALYHCVQNGSHDHKILKPASAPGPDQRPAEASSRHASCAHLRLQGAGSHCQWFP
jgi:hypothetical protein